MVSRGSPVTKAGSMGHHCPVCRPTRVWDCSSSHHSIRTTQVLWNYLQRCSSAGQRATQQSLNVFLCYRNKPIQAEGRICPFMHRENAVSYFSPQLIPAPLTPPTTWSYHLHPFVTLAFYPLRGYSCLLPLPLGKRFIKDNFPKRRGVWLRAKHVHVAFQ